MCGIIGYVGKNNNCVRVLIDGLEKLEYRGYDSAGIAFVKDDNVEIIKKEGKILNLKENVDFDLKSNLGIEVFFSLFRLKETFGDSPGFKVLRCPPFSVWT